MIISIGYSYAKAKLVAILLLVPMSLCRNRSFSHEFGGHHRHFSSGSSGGATSNTTAVVRTPHEIRLARGTNKDVVSRNITMVLENLLMNYENSQLPTHGKDQKRAKVEILDPMVVCTIYSS
ncbi:hypothetical protein TKK_0016268 [Trichogramma kaykai]